MLPLNEIKFVDLKKSGYDAEASDPSTGHMVYKKPKHYLQRANGSPDKETIAKEFGIVLKWGTTQPRDLSRLVWAGYKPLTIEDGIYPEPLHADGEGRFMSFDAFPMKIPVAEYIKIRERDIAKSENATKRKQSEFYRTTAETEEGAELSQEEVNKILGL